MYTFPRDDYTSGMDNEEKVVENHETQHSRNITDTSVNVHGGRDGSS